MYVLGIETSCDETSVSLLSDDPKVQIIDTLTYSQIELYEQWGGVVPEIASRNHLKKILPLYIDLLKRNNISEKQIDLIGVTTHPGLLGPLLTGLMLAKSISMIHKIPIFPINHLFAHLEAIHLSHKVSYPYLGVVLSGGHSFFSIVKSSNDIEIFASTIDDAAGEAFDKGGKILGLNYPAGVQIDAAAKLGNSTTHKFPRGLSKDKSTMNMSFSGIKTSIRMFCENKNIEINSAEFNDICASYQEAIIDTVLIKLKIALQKFNLPIVIGGGVACNSRLRKKASSISESVYFVDPQYCTDNAGMIAHLAYLNKEFKIPFPQSLDIEASSRFIDKKSING